MRTLFGLGASLLLTLTACGDDEGMNNNNDGGSNSNFNRWAECGNSIREWNEACDGTDFRGVTCEYLGWEGGDLRCLADCSEVDYSGCTGQPPCGNGVLDPGESCDGDVFFQDYNTCESLVNAAGPVLGGTLDRAAGPFVGGTLYCDGNCNILLTYCEADSLCGNAGFDGKEQCDDGALNSDTEPDRCRTNCRWAHCGDGVVDTMAEEYCDDGLDNSNTRPDACRWDCSPARCGDGVKDTPEVCDGADLGGVTCAALGFQGGTLICDESCQIDTTDCTP